MNPTSPAKHWIAALFIFAASSLTLFSQETTPAFDTGNTAFMFVCSVLVLLMTLPGLALFYGGLVRSKNVLSLLVQCFAMAGVMSLLWVIYGYSFATTDNNPFIGGASKIFLNGVTPESDAGGYPETIFIMFQMTFAIITPALIVGAFAERVKFSAVMIFSIIWFSISYLPIWHMAWNTNEGFFHRFHVLDFAGGTVVHINAAVAGLVGCLMVGPRKGFQKIPLTPHNVPLVVIGAALLWIGWFGFNAGSELAADGTAGMAMLVTQIACATAVVVWMIIERILTGVVTAVGAATGAVAGLVAITPASGTAGVPGALCIGAVSAILCYYFAIKLKHKLGYDDSLDVFGVHGIGGIVGAVLTGVFCFESMGGSGAYNDTISMGSQVWGQIVSVLITIVWSGVAAFIAFTIAKFTVGLRINERSEESGLDQTDHGESAYTDLQG
ncbi:MAG: ammonium transporter [Akkermansiaceae bacterium]